jgi:MoxR-like ATPase
MTDGEFSLPPRSDHVVHSGPRPRDLAASRTIILNFAKSTSDFKPNYTPEDPRAFPWDAVYRQHGKVWSSSDSRYDVVVLNIIDEVFPERRDPLAGLKIAKEQWKLFEAAVYTGKHVLAHGRPGTGKSRYAFETARNSQRRLDVINMRPNLPVDPLVGHYIPNERGSFDFMYGVISSAMKEGGLLLVNEIDHATGDAESIMHFALDDPSVASVTLPNAQREIIRPQKGYQVVATMNGLASQDLSAPIYSRFACKIRIDFPNPAAADTLDDDLKGVAFTDYRNADPNRIIPDLRMLYNFQAMRKTMPSKTAAKLVFEAQADEFLSAIIKAA